METKVCNTCKQEKSTDDFSKMTKSKDGFQYKCKVCAKEYLQIYNKSRHNYEHHREVCRQYRASQPPGYYSWTNMKERCSNPDKKGYQNYGGRGITVCDRWLGKDGFKNFMEDMGPKPEGYTLDRIDNDGDYEPDNCKWSTWREQANNRRPRGSNLMTDIQKRQYKEYFGNV